MNKTIRLALFQYNLIGSGQVCPMGGGGFLTPTIRMVKSVVQGNGLVVKSNGFVVYWFESFNVIMLITIRKHTCMHTCEMKVLVAQLCPTLCNPMDCSPPGSSVHGISQARTLEWVATPFSRGSSQPRDQTPVSYPAGRFFTIWATREAPVEPSAKLKWGPLIRGGSVSVTIEH